MRSKSGGFCSAEFIAGLFSVIFTGRKERDETARPGCHRLELKVNKQQVTTMERMMKWKNRKMQIEGKELDDLAGNLRHFFFFTAVFSPPATRCCEGGPRAFFNPHPLCCHGGICQKRELISRNRFRRFFAVPRPSPAISDFLQSISENRSADGGGQVPARERDTIFTRPGWSSSAGSPPLPPLPSHAGTRWRTIRPAVPRPPLLTCR